jgi:hypothetical protein
MASKNETYAPGSHTNSIRALHDARRTELLARDEVLSAEIEALQAERHDINEALQLMSQPASNVVDLARAAE